MIVDGFTFFNELDLLEIRLEELYPVVDRFVIVEADRSFRGNPKPSYFFENFDRYKKYIKKIHYTFVRMGRVPVSKNPIQQPWDREYHQRRKIDQGLTDLGPEDIVLISDVDEIPRRAVVENLEVNDRQVSLRVTRYTYGINMLESGYHTVKAIKYKNYTNAQDERMLHPSSVIEDAGWEFSSCGTPEYISHKLKNFAHQELDVEEYTDPDKILARIQGGFDVLDRHDKVRRVEIDETWPEAVKNNRDKYRHLEW